MRSMQRNQGGFTITELIVMMAIIAITSSIVLAVNSRELRRDRINATTVGLSGWIEEVRRAALRGYPCRITIAANAGAAGGTVVATAAEVLPEGESMSSDPQNARCQTKNPFRIPNELAGIRVAISPATTFVFGTLGTVDPATDKVLVLSLLKPGGQVDTSRCIRIRGMLGFIEVGNRNGGICSYANRY